MRQRRFELTCPSVLVIAALVAAGVWGVLGGPVTLAQSGSGNPLRGQRVESDPLTTQQTRLSDRYDQLELLAGRLAELSGATQPRRARLLRELVAKSRERDIPGRFERIVAALGADSLGQASKDQLALQVDLQNLLDLLLQEDRDRQIESERKRIRKYLAEVNRLIRLQRGIKARTDGGDDADELTVDQRRLAEATENLEQQIQASEGQSPRDPNKQDSGSQGPDTKEQGTSAEESPETDAKENDSSAKKPNAKENKADAKEQAPQQPKPASADQNDDSQQDGPQGEPQSQGEPRQGELQQGESQRGESQRGESQQGKSAEGSPTDSPSSPGDGQSSEPSQSPAERAQQRLKQAQQRMQQALERLEEAKAEQAVDRQEQALRELEQAKAELERILRQLREEELERMLVLLEARFRKMLDAQVVVYEQTKTLDANQSSVPVHEIEIASGRLDRQEREIVREADRALVLLREDGTTVAFPEAIEQARADMQGVAKRLGEVKLGLITQGLEEDVIAALEETLAALQQALKTARAKKSQPQQGSPGEPGDQSLVDQLAELRMIRALQNRINSRTQRYGDILGDQPATEVDLLEALDDLALRQERIFKATRDLDSGRNK